jgi:hypothetical protein
MLAQEVFGPITANHKAKMLDSSEFKARGWTYVPGVTSRAKLLELARSIGRPVPAPTGELVKELVPQESTQAREGTLSRVHGKGVFPLHTDTAFWPRPSKYIVLRTCGDIRRCTTVLRFADLFPEDDAGLRARIDRSVWLSRTSSRGFYCSMRFRSENAIGWRYDCQCMAPANDAALEVRDMIGPRLTRARPDCISWTSDVAVILYNWEVLHGRGPAPPNEGVRILERIYVE